MNLEFPSNYYDQDYYAHMAPGNWSVFIHSKGRALLDCRIRALELVRVKPGMRLLDLGCGRGELVMYCGAHGIDAYGVDYSETALKLGISCYPFFSQAELANIHLLRADVSKLPFPDNYFDRVMSWAVAEHLYQHQLESCLVEVYRVLKSTGVFVLGTHPNEWYEKYGYRLVRPVKQLFVARRLESYAQIKRNEPEHVNVKNPLALKRDFQRQGFVCRVRLLPRNEYEVKGLAAWLGHCLEKAPIIRAVFRNHILVTAAKSSTVLAEFCRGRR